MEIKQLKQKLVDNWQIHNDRDLIKQLEIKDTDREKLHTWTNYQSAFAYRDGYDAAVFDFLEQLDEFIYNSEEDVILWENGDYPTDRFLTALRNWRKKLNEKNL